MSAVDLGSRTLTTPRGVWTIEAKHDRPGGDVDVVLSFRADGNRSGVFFGYRRDQGHWTQLVGAYTERHRAVAEFARQTRTQVLAYRDLVPLLDLATGLADFPDAVLARSGEA